MRGAPSTATGRQRELGPAAIIVVPAGGKRAILAAAAVVLLNELAILLFIGVTVAAGIDAPAKARIRHRT